MQVHHDRRAAFLWRSFVLGLFLLATWVSCSGESVSGILMIGDGLGDGQRTAARWASAGFEGLLHMDALPIQGWAATAPAFGSITDSAAAATAMASGTKTLPGMVGLDPLLRSLPTLLELARNAGLAVGLITTTSVTHATPAAFAAHVVNRSLETWIAEQLLDAEIDILLGGGERYFLPDDTEGRWGRGARLDDRNLLDEAAKQGTVIVRTPHELTEFAHEWNERPGSPPPLAGLFAHDGLVAPYSPTLAEMTRIALDLLSRDPDGFFLMIEGGQIDWACHSHDIDRVIETTLGFDAAVEVAATFLDTHPETLLVVTADHETGGLAVQREEIPEDAEHEHLTTPDGCGFLVSWATTGHTADDVPVSALGVGAERLSGAYENTWIFDAMSQAMGLSLPAGTAP